MKDLILSYLQDEESKYIFKKRIEFNETGDSDVFIEIADRYWRGFTNADYCINLKNKIANDVAVKENVWIWGAGMYGRDLVHRLRRNGITVKGIIDNDKNKKEFCGISVFLPENVNFKEIDCLIISMLDGGSIKNCIDLAASKELDKEKILLYSDYIIRVQDKEQYFSSLIKYENGECFVDAGVFDLETSFRFARQCILNNASDFKVYAFEPDKISYRNCMEIKKQHLEWDIRLLNLGLYSSDMKIGFNLSGGSASRIAQEKGTDEIDVVCLDSVIDEKVTFIKMDIEGAELEALKGCKSIIRKYKPKLAICVYHKSNDIIEIPHYIKQLVPEYRLYLRHYSNYDGETVLYALPY